MSAAPQIEAPSAGCFHCGESIDGPDAVFEPVGGELHGFCCHGCLGAAELIHELGLFAYYDRREAPDASLPPLEPGRVEAFERFDDPALQQSFVTSEPEGDRSASLSVGGMRCAACSWLLEERLARVPGVREAHFGLANQRARVRWSPDETKLSEILGRIAELGYRAAPFEPDANEALIRDERRAALRRLGVSGLGAMQVMMFSVALYAGAFGDLEPVHRDLLRAASLLVTAPVLAYAGLPFLLGAWRDLRVPRVGPDVPIALALLGAFGASTWATYTGSGETYFDSVCMFIFFITLGRTLERDLRARAELRIRGLQQRVPQIAHRFEDGREKDVPASLVEPGDVLVVRPAETIPADGIVTGGGSTVSEALLTGEEAPVPKQPGSPLLAGTQNFDGTLHMRVERTGAASTLQQISTLLDRAHLDKPPIAELADRLARVFLTSVVLLAAAVGLVWWQIDSVRVVPVVVSVLIATCPCALSLATPAALAAATHGLAARGFLITRGHVLEALTRVTSVVFDKTGTLTASAPTLVGVHLLRSEVGADEALAWAARLEQASTHPIARALRAAAPASTYGPEPSDLCSEPGAGVSGTLDGRKLRLGRFDWSAAHAASRSVPIPVPRPSGSVSPVLLADEDGPIAWFGLETELRPEAKTVTGWLGREGYACSLLSGDPSKPAVDSVARQLDLQDARAGATPAAKLDAVSEQIAGGATVMAVGDGANDAPLLGLAQVSVAMGSGTDLARLSADAVLLDDRLGTIPVALRWARRARRVMQQNFAWALAYNLSVLPLAATGLLPPYLAAIGMSLSSLLVVGNSLRLRRAPRAEQEGV
jgi:Cu2+-exporting ATPase